VIEGLGIDVVNIERFADSLERTPQLRERLFTERERTLPISSLAARFAAKEALYKALRSDSGLNWHDAEVINEKSGKPAFIFAGDIADLIDGARVHLSLSHDAGVASAVVIVERE
jgi:holo-[acyl-carrier protein] synthase